MSEYTRVIVSLNSLFRDSKIFKCIHVCISSGFLKFHTRIHNRFCKVFIRVFPNVQLQPKYAICNGFLVCIFKFVVQGNTRLYVWNVPVKRSEKS